MVKRIKERPPITMQIPINKNIDDHHHKIRRSATITPFGVGAIFDAGDESFVAMDTTHWDKNAPIIRLRRLESELGASHFCTAPLGVPYHRFPEWLFCGSCRVMTKWNRRQEEKNQHPICTKCGNNKKLTPMRFVAACAGGHLADVPWEKWAHSHSKIWQQKQCEKKELHFEQKKGGGGLDSLFVTCNICGASRSFQDLQKKDALKGIMGYCPNKQPWEQTPPSTRSNCEQFPQVIQRGASNLYFPKIEVALDIPNLEANQSDNTTEKIKKDQNYKFLKDAYISKLPDPENDVAVKETAKKIANRVKCKESSVINTVKMELTPSIKTQIGPEGLLIEEWNAFLKDNKTEDFSGNFTVEKTNTTTFLNSFNDGHYLKVLASKLGTIVLAKRLREVRVLKGFERIKPGEIEFSIINPSLDTPTNWLPGIEVFGEGILITLNENELADWECKNKNAISERLNLMKKNRSKCNLTSLAAFSPRFVLLHTLSHIIIRQLGFECGYSSASLRERIYSANANEKNEGMAGVLIYTADGDSDGALGGLVREGQPERLLPMLATALQKAKWCSGDPICKELETQGLNGLNRAACHACSLIGETSCTSANVMLDRALLTEGGKNFLGYFGNFF
jgi:hypothetical protein